MAKFNHFLQKTRMITSKKPIRILHIVTTMNRGGLETMLMNYYRHIDRNQIQFDFLVHRAQESDYEKEILNLGGHVYRIPPMRPFSFSYRKALRQFFESHPEYSIIHVHQDCMSSIALSEAKRSNIPVRIAHCHSSNQDRNWKYPIKLFYKKKIAKSATSLFSCSLKSGLWMFETDEFNVLNNAIDTNKFSFSDSDRIKSRQNLNIPDDCFLIGHVGRFNEVKNQIFLIRLFSEYLKFNSKTRLILAGTGPMLQEAEKEVVRLRISDKVIFTGLRDDIPSLMSAMDLFVLPSLYEGTPMVLIEAQTSGLPCLISDSIPEDCDLTSTVKRCSLQGGLQDWIAAIETADSPDRMKAHDQIREKGFDIQENAEWLQEYYLSFSENS